jgi:isopentenyl diphosphate isomerase/L-lactate dehydrogenase-like FMN-dependent dehydrogenase
VAKVLDILRRDIDCTMRLAGAASVAEIDRSLVRVPAEWER